MFDCFMMKLLWFSLLLFCSQCLCDNSTLQCQKISSCKCVFPTSVGVNLLPINIEKLWLSASMTSINATFFFHPCSDLPYGSQTGDDDCSKGASVCLFNKTTGKYKNLGSSSNVAFFSQGVTEDPTLAYYHKNFTTAIHLKCAFVNQSTLVHVPDANKNVTHATYLFELQSLWACPTLIATEMSGATGTSDGLSTGSVLVIIFLVFVLIYLMGGAIALKLLRGAEGREMIPNYDFWAGLPQLCKDGAIFVFSGFQTTPSYDRI